MSQLGRRSLVRCGAVAAFSLVLGACGSDCDDPATATEPTYAVLSAFPAELEPLVEQAEVEETIVLDNGKLLRVGRLAGVRVVLGMTGIGLLNAQAATREVLERYDVAGVVVSGVAGSQLRIADVAVPESWVLVGGDTYRPLPRWLDLAERIADSVGPSLERCTIPVSMPSRGEVCMPFEPAVVVGGEGESSDPFGNMALTCRHDGDEIFGCDFEPTTPPSSAAGAALRRASGTTPPLPYVVDMETAAIAAEAAAHDVPFIAFRAVSDGAEDPLMLQGSFTQFFAYYRLAAHNAAAATVAFLGRVTPR